MSKKLTDPIAHLGWYYHTFIFVVSGLFPSLPTLPPVGLRWRQWSILSPAAGRRPPQYLINGPIWAINGKLHVLPTMPESPNHFLFYGMAPIKQLWTLLKYVRWNNTRTSIRCTPHWMRAGTTKSSRISDEEDDIWSGKMAQVRGAEHPITSSPDLSIFFLEIVFHVSIWTLFLTALPRSAANLGQFAKKPSSRSQLEDGRKAAYLAHRPPSCAPISGRISSGYRVNL
jgi:hypothetical protein